MTTWAMTTFQSGDRHAFASRHTMALAEPTDLRTTDTLWRLVANDAPLEEILEQLSGGGLRSLPSFALARFEGDGARIVLRGHMEAEVEDAAGDRHSFGAESVGTWFEVFVHDAVIVRLDADGDAASSASQVARDFEVLAGVVPARSVQRDVRTSDPRSDLADREWLPQAPVTAQLEISDTLTASAAEPTDSYEDLLGPSDPLKDDAHEADLVPPPLPPPPPTVTESLEAMDPAETPPVLGDHDGLTVSLRDRKGQRSDPGAAHDTGFVAPAGMVAAVMCPQNHPNPPGREVCRTCRLPVPRAAPAPVARPPLFVLAFSTGLRLPVDRPLLIGRNPRLAGGAHEELPRFIKLDDVGHGVSRTHAEIRVDGWEAVLADAGSSNGTDVQSPGEPSARRLQRGETVALVPGLVVDLGGDVQFTVEDAT